MSLDEPHTLERERRVADKNYNDALTAFDAALVRTPARADIGIVIDSTNSVVCWARISISILIWTHYPPAKP